MTEWTSTHMDSHLLKKRKISTRSPGDIIDLDHFTAPFATQELQETDGVFILD